MTILTWLLTVLLGLFFPLIGIAKIFGIPKKSFKQQKKQFFDNYGIDRKGIRSIGFAELIAGIAIWFWSSTPFVAQSAAFSLILITAGATFFHFVYDKEPAPQLAIGMLILSTAFFLMITL